MLLTFVGVFGIHRFYQGKWVTGALYLLTGGLFVLGIAYDFWTLNDQISEANARAYRHARGDALRRASARVGALRRAPVRLGACRRA